ncbi:signal peptidase I [Streptomyces lavendulae]|uniref:signal peptidase I n=1 Tax=Streptomyces lavendulae TaxID=1914 RepID=UPI0036C1F191
MQRRPGRKRGIWAIVLLVLGGALIAGPIVFVSGRFTVVHQYGDNMAPTLAHGDLVVLRTDTSALRRGDVVIYDPGTWGLKGPFIGRVAALGGEHISYAMGDKVLTLDGQPLDEPYLNGLPGDGGVAFDVAVPQGKVFILGDNRGNSADSRFHLDSSGGTLPVSAVTGIEQPQRTLAYVAPGLAVLTGLFLLPVGIGLGIAALVVRRRKPVPAGPVWGAVHVEQP